MCELSEFGPLMHHDGTGCPLVDGAVVWVRYEADPGDFRTAVLLVCAENRPAWDWDQYQKPVAGHGDFAHGRIVSYRIKRTRGMISLCEIAADPSALVGVPA